MSRLTPWLVYLAWVGALLPGPAVAQDEPEPFRDFRAELLLAIELNDLEATRKALDEGATPEINQGDPSPLGTAVVLDNLNMVALLLRSGGDPDVTADSPLLAAVRNDSFDMVRLLFLSGARLRANSDELLQLALRGDNAMALYEELLDRGADVDQALRVAVEGHKLPAAQLCLERGAAVSSLGEGNILDLVSAERIPEILAQAVRDDNRQAALSYFLSLAAADGDRELVDLLLDEGAVITVDHLERAERGGHDAIVFYLLERSGEDLQTFAERAEDKGHDELAAFLRGTRNQRIGSVVVPVIIAAASLFVILAIVVFLRKNILRSPRKLHEAVARGDLGRLEKLLDAGADPNSSHGRRQPLHVAARHGNLKLARALLHHGARGASQASDDAGLTALHTAAERGNISLAELFLRHGVQADVRSGTGLTPLYVAARAGRGEMVNLLLERGADLHAMVHQQTLLFIAVSNRDLDAAKLLLEVGADPNADRGRTALHAAAALGAADFTRLLLSYGADVHAVDADGRTPLALAQFHKRVEVVEVLERPTGGGEEGAPAPPVPAPPPVSAVPAAPAPDPRSLVTQPIGKIAKPPSGAAPMPPAFESPGAPVSVLDGPLTIPHPEPVPEKPRRPDEDTDGGR